MCAVTVPSVVIRLKQSRKCLRKILLRRYTTFSITYKYVVVSSFVKSFVLWIPYFSVLFTFTASDQVWRLQAALGEQTEITKFSQQEYERLQNVMLSSSHSKGVQLSQSFYFGVSLSLGTCFTLFCVPGESSVQDLFRKRDQCGIASMQTPCSLQVFILKKKP